MTIQKSAFVTIIGHPNAGKSTLLNAIIGEKIAITSAKIQTTRHRIKAIYNIDEFQIIFSDTPGILKPLYLLHEKMLQQINQALSDTDILLYLVDGRETNPEYYKTLFSYKTKKPAPFFVVVNKIDKLSSQEKQYCQQLIQNELPDVFLFFISALKKQGIESMIAHIKTIVPEHPHFYEGDEITDKNLRFIASELVREQLFKYLDKELPYQTTVMVQQYKEKKNITVIQMDIVVHRESQRIIVLGKQGNMLRKISTAARLEIEKLIQQKVFLDLYVKVKPNWRDNPLQLKEYGYET